VASTSTKWVSAQVAHACELNIPYNQTRSQFVIDNTIKAVPFYTLETWFLNSPDPLIPHNVDLNALLSGIRSKTRGSGYRTDWDFNTAVTDAFNREQDGHTEWESACTTAFSWNHPFSVANWANSPFDPVSFPHVVVNYDLPLQGRSGLEAYYQSLGLELRPYDGFQILSINGQDSNAYLTNLAQASSIYDGLFGAYESLEPRYLRLVSRYSADTASGAYTQEIGKFASRAYYPGAKSIKFVLSGNGRIHDVEGPLGCDLHRRRIRYPFLRHQQLPYPSCNHQRHHRTSAAEPRQSARHYRKGGCCRARQRLESLEPVGFAQVNSRPIHTDSTEATAVRVAGLWTYHRR